MIHFLLMLGLLTPTWNPATVWTSPFRGFGKASVDPEERSLH
jgi:hypothetical protein